MRSVLIQADALEALRRMPDGLAHTVVTSPPYWALRDYGVEGQLGLEPNPEEYVERLVEIFREVRRVLRDDGTAWVNLGDTYLSAGGAGWQGKGGERENRRHTQRALQSRAARATRSAEGLKPKDLVGIPWRVAFALQADGWYLRSDIIWHKPNPMPESVTDRPTKAHEYLFLLSKSQAYFYDAHAIREPLAADTIARSLRARNPDNKWANVPGATTHGIARSMEKSYHPDGRNKRSVWSIPTHSYKEAHFATFPTELVEPCILAGTSAGEACGKCGSMWQRIVTESAGEPLTRGWQPSCACGTQVTTPCIVLDPFSGAATTGIVAMRKGRQYIGTELNPQYVEISRARFVSEGFHPPTVVTSLDAVLASVENLR